MDYTGTYVQWNVRRDVRQALQVFSAFLDGLIDLRERTQVSHQDPQVQPRLIYGGDRVHLRSGVEIVPWNRVHGSAWR